MLRSKYFEGARGQEINNISHLYITLGFPNYFKVFYFILAVL